MAIGANRRFRVPGRRLLAVQALLVDRQNAHMATPARGVDLAPMHWRLRIAYRVHGVSRMTVSARGSRNQPRFRDRFAVRALEICLNVRLGLVPTRRLLQVLLVAFRAEKYAVQPVLWRLGVADRQNGVTSMARSTRGRKRVPLPQGLGVSSCRELPRRPFVARGGTRRQVEPRPVRQVRGVFVAVNACRSGVHATRERIKWHKQTRSGGRLIACQHGLCLNRRVWADFRSQPRPHHGEPLTWPQFRNVLLTVALKTPLVGHI